MNTTKTANRLIIKLVETWDKAPAEVSGLDIGFGLDIWQLATKASILSEEDATRRKKEFLSGAMDSIPVIGKLLVDMEWVEQKREERTNRIILVPTPKGIDYAHSIIRPWTFRFTSIIKESAKTIIIAAITAAVTTLVAYLILKLIEGE